MAIPTITDKVILVDFSLAETNAFALQEIDTQRQFSATDRGTAFIGFKAETIANGMTADISLANLDDDSRVNRTFTVTTGTNFDAINKIFYYQIPDDEIVHWGNWIGYGKFTEGATSKVWTGRKFKYSISRDITNDPETKLIVMDDVNSFLASMAIVKSDLEADHAQAQADHANYAGLLEDGVLTTQIIAKLTELETTYAPDLFAVKQQLEHKVGINLGDFSLVGDGVADDAPAIQALIDDAAAHNINQLVFPQATYKIGTPIDVPYDNLTLDFSGSTVIWNGTFNNGYQSGTRKYGVFKVWGKIDRNVDGTLKYSNVTAFSSGDYATNCTIKTDNDALFTVGDFVRVDLATGHSGLKTDKLYPELNVMAQVLEVDPTAGLTLDFEVGAFDFSVAPWTNSGSYEEVNGVFEQVYPPTISGARVYKVTPVKNVTIKNFFFKDLQPYTSGVTNVNTCLCGISAQYAYKLNIKNLHGEHMKFPLILTKWCHSYNLSDIYGRNSDDVNAGMGYVVQNMYSLYVTCKRIKGSNVRHTVDFSGVLHASLEDCYDTNNLAGASGIAFHGMCEYDIVATNCGAGRYSFGHGIDSFSDICDSLKFTNCRGDISTDQKAYLGNSVFKNHVGAAPEYLNVFNVVFDNCKIDFSTTIIVDAISRIGDLRRNIAYRAVKFIGCDLTFKKMRMQWYDKIEFERCKITFTSYSLGYLESRSNNNMIFNQCDFYNMGFYYLYGDQFLDATKNPNAKEISILVKNNRFYKKDNTVQSFAKVLTPVSIANCKVNITVAENQVDINKQAVAQSVDSFALGYFGHGVTINYVTSDYTGAEILLNYINNQLMANNANGVALYTDTPAVYTLKKVAVNNIIKNAATFDTLDGATNTKY